MILDLLSFLRIWPTRIALWLIASALPACLGLALLVADLEERSSIARHRETGIGPTPRWTARSSWLAYDSQTRQLSGAD